MNPTETATAPETNSSIEDLQSTFGAPAEPSPEPTITESSEPAAIPAKEPTFRKEDVAEILKGVLPQAQAQPTPAQEKQYTPEELNQMFNVFQPDEALLTEMGLMPEAAPAVAKLRDALMKQANTYAEARLAMVEKQLEAKYGPLLQHIQQQEAAKREEAFYTENSDLADHKETVALVLAHLRQQNIQPKSPEEGAKLLADTTRVYLKKLGVVLPTGDGGSLVQPKPIKMATLSGGGQGAAARGASSASSGGLPSDLKAIFGG